MAYLLRSTLYNVELIEYYERPTCACGTVAGSLLSRLDVDSEGRDYTVENGKRSHAKVLEYGACNPWTHFVTFTFSPRRFDRADSDACMKTLITYFDNYRKRSDPSFRYVFVPEPHPASGMIHVHGLVYLSEEAKDEKHLDLTYMYTDIKSGRKCHVYRSEKLLEKFGRNNFTKIAFDSIACTYYISKYIQKTDKQLLSHRYYCSQGLKGYEKVNSVDKPETLNSIRCFLFNNGFKPCFENGFITKYVFPGTFSMDQILSGKPVSDSDQAFYNKKRLEYLRKLERRELSRDEAIDSAVYSSLNLEQLSKIAPSEIVPRGLFPDKYDQFSFFDDPFGDQ